MNAPLPPSCEQAMTELATDPPLTSRGSRAWNRSSKRLLLGMIDQPHRAALEAQGGELGFVQLEQDIHQGVAQAADVVGFHS